MLGFTSTALLLFPLAVLAAPLEERATSLTGSAVTLKLPAARGWSDDTDSVMPCGGISFNGSRTDYPLSTHCVQSAYVFCVAHTDLHATHQPEDKFPYSFAPMQIAFRSITADVRTRRRTRTSACSFTSSHRPCSAVITAFRALLSPILDSMLVMLSRCKVMRSIGASGYSHLLLLTAAPINFSFVCGRSEGHHALSVCRYHTR